MQVTKGQLEKEASNLTTGIYSIDTETSGLRPYHGSRLFSLIISNGSTTWYFNFQRYPDIDDALVLPREETFLALKPFFSNTENVVFLHNAKFDQTMLAFEGVHIRCKVYDTEVLGRLLYNRHIKYSLGSLVKEIGLEKSTAVEEYIAKNKLFTWTKSPGREKRSKWPHYDKVPFEIMAPYGEKDGDITWKLGTHQLAQLDSLSEAVTTNASNHDLKELVELESKVTRVCLGMERAGVLIDKDYCKKAFAYERDRVSRSEAEFEVCAGMPLVDSRITLAKAFTEAGEKYPVTEKGNPSFTEEVLKGFTTPLAQIVKNYRASSKRANTYFANFIYFADGGNRIHPNMRQAGTDTGRFCIAKGTPIDVVRDVSKFAKGVPIEEVTPGMLAYCYDSNLDLRLKKVLNVWKTGENKQVIRLHWRGQGRKHTGYLDVTPDHLIRLVSGEYARAADLKINQSLLALGRSRTLGYSRLHSRNKEMREHRFIFKEIKGYYPDHVHHVDGNKLNHCAENLQGLAASEHTSFHAKELSTLERIKTLRSINMKKGWADGKLRVKEGIQNPSYIKTTRFSLLREFAKKGGKPTKCKDIVKDFNTFKKKCTQAGISIPDVSKRYDNRGEYLSKGRFIRVANLPQSKKLQELGIGYDTYRKLCDYYDLPHKANNHIVTKIELIEKRVDVYDLEVEDEHNFIANEICVHNSYSDPNLQNCSKESGSKVEYPVRRAFVPTPGYFFAMLDYDQVEFRVMLDYAEEMPVIRKIIEDGLDVHTATANTMGVSRTFAKTLNFMLIYGGGAQKLADSLGVSLKEGKELKEQYFGKLPKVGSFINKVVQRASTRGYIFNAFGRVCWFPYLNNPRTGRKDRFAYKAPNHLIQGCCADIIKTAMVRVDEYLKEKTSRLILTIHDELLLEVSENEDFVIEHVKSIMEKSYIHKKLPLECSADFSRKSWFDKEPWNFDKHQVSCLPAPQHQGESTYPAITDTCTEGV